MGLRDYFKKRDFKKTPEPKGNKKHSAKKLRFVIQKHNASQLHYDFRLELDGVLKSWAVPKGPSLNPHDHRLAVHTEDHPYSYKDFAGDIPKGNYGAGHVDIWDEGWYEPRTETTQPEKTLREEHETGHITFVLHGKKLKGEFALIKMKDDKNWLLVKKDDNFAESQSTFTDTSLPIESYPQKTAPWTVKPMLCTLVEEPFSDEGWLFEVKWDGYRAIAAKHNTITQLYSRNANNFAEKYPEVVEAVANLNHDVILDGEIVVVDSSGVPHFELLQDWHKAKRGVIRYYVFDILWKDGYDIRNMPLIQRKALLQKILPKKNSLLFYSDHIETKGKELFKKMQSQHLEGMVAKRAASTYNENRRGDDWLKIKTHLRQEVVIGGYTEPRGGRQYFGSLLAGVYKNGQLEYVGHSGGGIADKTRKDMLEQFKKLEQKTSPFTSTPKPNAPVHWIKPILVGEMEFSEWTSDGRMRHPQFKGLRPDKKPHDVHHETAQKVHETTPRSTAGHFEFTHLDKIFFPAKGYTKGDLVDYYTSVQKFILPYIKQRPCSLLRQPDGIGGMSFFQKNMEHLPDWVPHADIYSGSNKADLRWLVPNTLEALHYMVQLGCVEINPWNARVTSLDKPDWLVIDLDPEGVSFTDVVTVAKTVHKLCDEWGVPAYPKTSGKTGIHIFVPLGAKYTHEQAKNFAHLLALEINNREPNLTSVERMPKKRPHKIYVDFLQNREGQTLAAPYSVRPTPDASVSTPLHWDEVTTKLRPEHYTIQNTTKRLESVGDLWKPVRQKGINLEKIITSLDS